MLTVTCSFVLSSFPSVPAFHYPVPQCHARQAKAPRPASSDVLSVDVPLQVSHTVADTESVTHSLGLVVVDGRVERLD